MTEFPMTPERASSLAALLPAELRAVDTPIFYRDGVLYVPAAHAEAIATLLSSLDDA